MPSFVNKYKIIFLGKEGKPSNSSKTFSLYCSFLLIYFEVGQKPKWNLLSVWILVQGFNNYKFAQQIQIYFSGKQRQSLKPLKSFLPILEFLINLFWSLSKALMKSYGSWSIGQCFRMTNLVDEYKIIFLEKRGKVWNSPKTFSLYWSSL